VLHNILT